MSASRRTPKQIRAERRAKQIEKAARQRVNADSKKAKSKKKHQMEDTSKPGPDPVTEEKEKPKPTASSDPLDEAVIDFNFVSFASKGTWNGPRNVVQYSTANRFSINEWNRVCTFHRICSALYSAESVSYHKWIPALNDYATLIPYQTSSFHGLSVHVDWEDDRNKKLVDEFEQKHGIALFPCCTIHTHVNASAFESGTDKADEKENAGWHITLGKLSSLQSNKAMDVHCRIVTPILKKLGNRGGMAVDVPTHNWITDAEEKDSTYLKPSMNGFYINLIEERFSERVRTYPQYTSGYRRPAYEGGWDDGNSYFPGFQHGKSNGGHTTRIEYTEIQKDAFKAMKEYGTVATPIIADIWGQKEVWIPKLMALDDTTGFPTGRPKAQNYGLYALELREIYQLCELHSLILPPKEIKEPVKVTEGDKTKAKVNHKQRMVNNLILMNSAAETPLTLSDHELREKLMRCEYLQVERVHNDNMRKQGFVVSSTLTAEDIKKKWGDDNPIYGFVDAFLEENYPKESAYEARLIPTAKLIRAISAAERWETTDPGYASAIEKLIDTEWITLFKRAYEKEEYPVNDSYTLSYLRELVEMFIAFDFESETEMEAYEGIAVASYDTLYQICQRHNLFKLATESGIYYNVSVTSDDDTDEDDMHAAFLEAGIVQIYKALYKGEPPPVEEWDDHFFAGMTTCIGIMNDQIKKPAPKKKKDELNKKGKEGS